MPFCSAATRGRYQWLRLTKILAWLLWKTQDTYTVCTEHHNEFTRSPWKKLIYACTTYSTELIYTLPIDEFGHSTLSYLRAKNQATSRCAQCSLWGKLWRANIESRCILCFDLLGLLAQKVQGCQVTRLSLLGSSSQYHSHKKRMRASFQSTTANCTNKQ